jgi:hypothetical protein
MVLLGGRPVALPSSSAGARRRRRPVLPFAHSHRPWPPSAIALPAHVRVVFTTASRWAARCAAVLFRRRSTSPAPGFALRPQPASVASFRYPLQGTPVWGSRSRAAVPAPPGARLALIWAVYPPKLPGSAPPPASLCPVCGPCALAAPPCRLTCPSSSSSSSAGPQKRCVSLSAAIALRAGVMPAGPCAGIAADTLPPPVCARTGGPCGERGPAHRSAEAQSPESASTFTRCHAGCCNAGRRAPRRPSAGVELADGVIEATVTQGRRARAPRAHRCTGRSRTTLHSA